MQSMSGDVAVRACARGTSQLLSDDSVTTSYITALDMSSHLCSNCLSNTGSCVPPLANSININQLLDANNEQPQVSMVTCYILPANIRTVH